MIYEFQDLLLPSILPRSRLYNLEPIGIGTCFSESLTSYTSRLALSHCVPLGKLILAELLPHFGKPYLSSQDNKNNSMSNFWKNNTPPLNGTCDSASKWVHALSLLTLRKDLQLLTMLPWANVLPAKGLIRRTRAWCPACYEYWRQSDQPIYDPLIWALEVVTICLLHERYLVNKCNNPICEKKLPFLSPYTRPGYCSYCGNWLGLFNEKSGNQALVKDELQWQLWVTSSMGEFVAAPANLKIMPKAESISLIIENCLTKLFHSNVSEASRQLQISRKTLIEWRQSTQLPQIASLLLVSSRLATTPLQLLTQGLTISILKCSTDPKTNFKKKKQYKAFREDLIKSKLHELIMNDINPPPSMKSIANDLGYDQTFLSKHFPEETRTISKKYQSFVGSKANERKRRIINSVQKATFLVHAKGLYPSQKRTRLSFSKPGLMLDPEVRATRYKALQELGWKRTDY